jgi:nucleoid DNA-binding protein
MKNIKQLNEIAEQIVTGHKVSLKGLGKLEKEIVNQTATKMRMENNQAMNEVKKLKKLGTSIFS